MEFNEDSSQLIITPEAHFSGQSQFKLKVSDLVNTSELSIIVSVREINDAPEFIFIQDFEFLEDMVFSIGMDTLLLDPDHSLEELEIELTSSDEAVQVIAADEIIKLVPEINFNGGPFSITISATDPLGANTQVELSYQIIPINDAPGSFSRIDPIDESSLRDTMVQFSWNPENRWNCTTSFLSIW